MVKIVYMFFTTVNKEAVRGSLALTRDFFLRKQRVTVRPGGAVGVAALLFFKGRSLRIQECSQYSLNV